MSTFCRPARAAQILGLSYPQRFNRLRRRLERVLVLHPDGTHEHKPLPQFKSAAQEKAYRATHIVVVPALGGVSEFGADFQYIEERCEAFRKALGRGPVDGEVA